MSKASRNTLVRVAISIIQMVFVTGLASVYVSLGFSVKTAPFEIADTTARGTGTALLSSQIPDVCAILDGTECTARSNSASIIAPIQMEFV